MMYDSGANFSTDRKYRYALWRHWDKKKRFAMFVGLNPSTADEWTDDPTIRRCRRFAQDWGYGGVLMTNLFAICATKPQEMLLHPSPVGLGNDQALIRYSHQAGIVVAAWGAHGQHMNRGEQVIRMLATPVHHLGLTKQGLPRHPLYLRADIQPILLSS